MTSPKLIAIIFLFLFTSLGIQNVYAVSLTAKATISVVNEKGLPIEGAKVVFAFEENKTSGIGVNVTPVQGLTDSSGRYTASHRNDDNVLTYGVEKEGYYYSTGKYIFSDRSFIGWKPWNPELKVVMRKIENPVPMYAKDLGQWKRVEIPVLDKEIGFDLISSDWVAPYGKGQYSDFIFILKRSSLNPDAFISTLTLKFSNKFDGIMSIEKDNSFGSQFKLNRFAPKNGYKNQLLQTVTKKSDSWYEESFRDSDNYIFRVRSIVKNNKLQKAMYGKILGPIRFYPARSKKTAIIEFLYYLNPDHTRNLEFDPKRNLFENLTPLERVKAP